VALGDGFTAGAAGCDALTVSDRLAEILLEASPSLDYLGLARPGALTADVAARQLPNALALEPDVVTVVCGGSDALLTLRPDVRAQMVVFEGLLEELRSRLPDAVVVTATTPDPVRFLALPADVGMRISRAFERVNEATAVAAARAGVPCLDFAAHPFGLGGRGPYQPSPEACLRAAGAFAAVIGVRLGIHLDTQEVI
jgi:lysophospholipase L1-like esterase